MRKFALASVRETHDVGHREDALILEALHARGAEARIIFWDEEDPVNLTGEVTVLRTTWNYQQHYPKFVSWLEGLLKAGGSLINPLDQVLGTIDKSYLADYRARGFNVPETVVVRSEGELAAALKDPAFTQSVIKPVVGGGAIGLRQIRSDNPETWAGVDFSMPQLLQRFLPEIETEGELSFVFFGGTFSHAIRKRAAKGDIRVQMEWGGTVEVIDPSPVRIAEAAHFLAALPGVPTYARVDVVEVAGLLTLMELEVIEPELFCLYVPEAAGRFADALIEVT